MQVWAIFRLLTEAAHFGQIQKPVISRFRFNDSSSAYELSYTWPLCKGFSDREYANSFLSLL